MTSTKAESAELILKLYDLRREKTMRKARKWFSSFNPASIDEVLATMMDPDVGGYFRMVIGYWEIPAVMVNHGAIDAEMWRDTPGEYHAVYAKLQPFIGALRERWQMPEAFSALEKCIMSQPNGAEHVRKTQDFIKQALAARSGQSKKSKDKKKDKTPKEIKLAKSATARG